MNYCPECGGPVARQVPSGDDRPRDVCTSCHRIHYQNPKLVVGALPEWRDRILLCRRAIAPRADYWTLPAGYLENGETAAEGAQRETREEAGAHVTDLAPFGLFDLPHVNQIYLMFRGRLTSPALAPGPESHAAALFTEAEIPWNRLAFTVIEDTLKCYFADRTRGRFTLHTGRIAPGRWVDRAPP